MISAAIGFIGGLASGLLGVGGGFVMVPLQAIWAKRTQRRSSGTSLAAILPIALVGGAVYYLGKGEPQADMQIALFLIPGSVVGAFLGASATRWIPERTLKVIVAVLLVAVGIKEIYDSLVDTAHTTASSVASLDPIHFALITVTGVVIGTLSGLTGVGGGIFLVPTLALGFGISQHVAQGTSLLAILPTAAVGALTHYRHRQVDLSAAAWMAVAGAPAALVGALLALSLQDRVLVGLFGAALIAAAVRVYPGRHQPESVVTRNP